MPLIMLWVATIWTAVAHIRQAIYTYRNGSKGISVASEFHNLLVSILLLSYAVHLGNLALIATRIVIVGGWSARWGAVALAKRNEFPMQGKDEPFAQYLIGEE